MNVPTSLSRRPIAFLIALVFVAVVVTLFAVDRWGSESEDPAAPAVVNPDVTPNGDAVVPDGLELGRLTVKGGAFDSDELVLQVDQPTVLQMDNEDGTAYRFQIVGLVDPTAVAPSGETTIDFTDPNAGTFEGRLLPQSGENTLDTITVVIQNPDGSV
jgi:hypothetical protein